MNKLALACFCAALSLTTPLAFANSQVQAQEAAQAQLNLANLTNSELQRVAGALQNYYVTNLAWPGNMSTQLGHYYSGNYSTPFGNITGTPISGSGSFQLVINANITDTNQRAALQSILTQQGGSLTGNTIVLNVDPPQSSATYASMLSRLPDTTGQGLNTMQTNLDMGGFNVNNIGSVNANSVFANDAVIGDMSVTSASIDGLESLSANITNAVITTAVTDTLDVNSLINAPTANLDTVNANLIDSDLVIATTIKSPSGIIGIESDVVIDGRLTANDITVSGDIVDSNGNTLVDQSGKLYYQNQDTDSRYLGINAKATDAALLDGIQSSQFARRDVSNTFTQAQTFQNRLYANAEIFAGGNRVVDGAGRLYFGGQNTDARYLGINATANNADHLGGVHASAYARKDQSNWFTQKQHFNAGINVAGTISTDNITASNTISTKTLILNGWNMGGLQGNINDLYNRSGSLQNQINDIKNAGTSRAIGKWSVSSYYRNSSSCSTSPKGHSFVTNDAICYVNQTGSWVKSGGTNNNPRCYYYNATCVKN